MGGQGLCLLLLDLSRLQHPVWSSRGGFNNSFLEIQFTCHTIHLFWANNPATFRIFTWSCNHRHNRFQTFASPQREALNLSISRHSAVFPPPSTPTQATSNLLLIFRDLPLLDISHNRTILRYVVFTAWLLSLGLNVDNIMVKTVKHFISSYG